MIPAVYVAGSSREIPRVRAAMAEVVSRGGVIVHDWCAVVDRAERGAPVVLVDELRCDVLAIRRATHVLWLGPRTPSIGAYMELGYAAGIGSGHVYASASPASMQAAWCDALGVARYGDDMAAIDAMWRGR